MPRHNPRLYGLEVPIVVELGRRTMPLRDVLTLLPGAVLDLHKPADRELTLLVNNQPVARGNAVKVGENFGLRITHVGATSEIDFGTAFASADSGSGDVSDSDAEDLAAQFLAGQ